MPTAQCINTVLVLQSKFWYWMHQTQKVSSIKLNCFKLSVIMQHPRRALRYSILISGVSESFQKGLELLFSINRLAFTRWVCRFPGKISVHLNSLQTIVLARMRNWLRKSCSFQRLYRPLLLKQARSYHQLCLVIHLQLSSSEGWKGKLMSSWAMCNLCVSAVLSNDNLDHLRWLVAKLQRWRNFTVDSKTSLTNPEHISSLFRHRTNPEHLYIWYS